MVRAPQGEPRESCAISSARSIVCSAPMRRRVGAGTTWPSTTRLRTMPLHTRGFVWSCSRKGSDSARLRRSHVISSEAFDGFVPERVADFLMKRALRTPAGAHPAMRPGSRVRGECAAMGGRGEQCRVFGQSGPNGGRRRCRGRLARSDQRTLQNDFSRIARRQLGRRSSQFHGIFTAFAHPVSRRALERLELVNEFDSPAAVQCFVGSIARVAGRDPYQLEATLALSRRSVRASANPTAIRARLPTSAPRR